MNGPEAAVKVGEMLLQGARELATKVGVTVEQVYPFYVKQAITMSWLAFMCFAAVGLAVVALGVWVIRTTPVCRREYNYNTEKSYNSPSLSYLIGWCVVLVGATITLASIAVNAPGIINPEYYAINELLSVVKK